MEIGGAQVGICPIAPQESKLDRRKREREAVGKILRAMLGDDAAQSLGHLPSGAPVVSGCRHISITHSRVLAAVAIHPASAVGIDAEEDRHDTLLRVASKFLSEEEQGWVDDADLLKAWTIKEAVYKAAAAPGLSATSGIALSPGLKSAKANGRIYSIACDRLGPTLLTIAVDCAPAPQNP